jgi:alpha-L-arabinofuranosidase
LTYRPLDRLFYSNILGAQAGATRRNILNTSGGNRGTAIAGLLAADYNAQNQLGNLFRQAEEYNAAQREKVATFNRATNMYNSEADLKAQAANTRNDEVKLDAAKAAANLRQAADAQASAARSANLTNFFDSLGNIGIDAYNREDRDRLIDAGVFGTLSQRPLGWSDKRWEDYQKAVSGKGYRNGGKLRRKKGLTI